MFFTKLNKFRGLTTTFTAVTAAMIAMTGIAAAEEAEKPTADLTVAALSQYIWRGYELSQDSIVIQPSMTIGYKGFSMNLWGNLDTNTVSDDTNNWNETDMTLSYSQQFGMVKLSGGYIYYSLDGLDDSQEVFVSAGLDVLLNPTLTIYREFAHLPSWYATLAVSHSIPVSGDITLDLGGQLSYLMSDDEGGYVEVNGDKFRDFHDGLISAKLNIPVTEYVKVTPQIYWAFPISDEASDEIKGLSVDGDDSNFIYGGISVSFSF